ncbi:MAG: hypothetical protein HXY18_03950 [Bryobacteraceae bacterium]|jgi:hypothetical protein|nr:hypothetical protein [Bryobacteraceae bacterium]
MVNWIVIPAASVSAILYLWLLSRLLRGYAREYSGLLLYVLVLVFGLVIDVATYGFTDRDRSPYFLISETARWGALYLAVLSFVWKALASHPAHQWIRHWLIALSAFTVFVAIFLTKGPNISIWILKTVNILSIAGMLLNLILWTLLVRTRSSDLILFLVTSGLGIQAALEAAAWSLRNFRSTFEAAYFVGIVGHLLCLMVWVFAFRKPAVRRA